MIFLDALFSSWCSCSIWQVKCKRCLAGPRPNGGQSIQDAEQAIGRAIFRRSRLYLLSTNLWPPADSGTHDHFREARVHPEKGWGNAFSVREIRGVLCICLKPMARISVNRTTGPLPLRSMPMGDYSISWTYERSRRETRRLCARRRRSRCERSNSRMAHYISKYIQSL